MIQCRIVCLIPVGTTTDGEFSSLRTRGETRALHLWQLVHDARDSVQRVTVQTLKEMLLVQNSEYDISFLGSIGLVITVELF